MKKISEFSSKIEFLFTDIDDTLTDEGFLGAEAYKALWDLHNRGVKIIPVTGRPAGWCEMIARFWPVDGIVGENGGFYFRYLREHKKMARHFFFPENVQQQNRAKLDQIAKEVLTAVPGCAIASDQFTRLMDLAIDFCEDVKPLPKNEVQKIVDVFQKHGAIAKVSSIHVNGWFGDYDKLKMCKLYMKNEHGLNIDQEQSRMAFCGDSPNDEPMFAFFKNSVAVANIQNFLNEIKNPPQYLCTQKGGHGFVEFAQQILKN
jgi:HAD superfamily hydrolase (TIGR01484 family)